MVDVVADSSEGSRFHVWRGTSTEPKVNNMFFSAHSLNVGQGVKGKIYLK